MVELLHQVEGHQAADQSGAEAEPECPDDIAQLRREHTLEEIVNQIRGGGEEDHESRGGGGDLVRAQ